jgi:hypothetical protein
MEYIYENKTTEPNLDQIHIEVANSAMIDKSIQWCRWDKGLNRLKVVFTDDLSSEDKTLLDAIIANNS